MPKIRSITFFDNTAANKPVEAARAAFEDAGIAVQTTRLATAPFPDLTTPEQTPDFAASLFEDCQQAGIDYCSIGPVRQTDDRAYLDYLPAVFRTVEGVFATAEIADKTNGVDLARLMVVAELIKTVSTLTDDGFSNLYLAALANCQPGSPFFPVAYHDGGDPAFALAIQGADLAVLAFQDAPDLVTARERLTSAIEDVANRLVPVAETIADAYDLRFLGLDFSLAPYPVHEESLAGAMESLGVQFGGAGLVAAASLVMNAIEAADFPSTGFSGLMLPILEDNILAYRATQQAVSLNDLLLLSAVCGIGLDCIPLPGDIEAEGLRDILLDVASLSLRLDKPLTARLMPFPGRTAGDSLQFEFEYFADSAVLPAPPRPTGNSLFAANIPIAINARKERR